ncbi:uncharacterized protein [Drosophila takahashii]|uniref:uncharacterized protein n=1 Tax=Drosophila takahashii TaxID=29030 RepID=UPI003898F327
MLKECANMWMVEPLKLVCEDIFQKRYPEMLYSDLLLYFEHAYSVDDNELMRIVSEGLHSDIKNMAIPKEIYELRSDVFKEYLNVIKYAVTEKCRFQMVEKYVDIHGLELDQNQSDLNKCEGHGLVNQREENLGTSKDLPVESIRNLNFCDANSECLRPSSKKIDSNYIKTMVNLIDYAQMTINEFNEGPANSNLIPLEDRVYITANTY